MDILNHVNRHMTDRRKKKILSLSKNRKLLRKIIGYTKNS